ncbi:MAG: hypothetical protein Rubg2KO_34370 [Rubricoccaceae bacterium]
MSGTVDPKSSWCLHMVTFRGSYVYTDDRRIVFYEVRQPGRRYGLTIERRREASYDGNGGHS